MTNSKKGKEENKWLREREKMGVRFCPSLSLSLYGIYINLPLITSMPKESFK